MMEWRRHPRVREEISVRWSVPKDGRQGTGIVRNVSISGLLLEVDEGFRPAEEAPLVIEALDTKLSPFIPKDVRLVWSGHVMADKQRKYCGLKFVDPTGPTFNRLREHVDGRLEKILQTTDLNIMNHYLYQSN